MNALIIRNKINELAEKSLVQWNQFKLADATYEDLKTSTALQSAKEKRDAMRDVWADTQRAISGLETLLADADGFGASDAEPSQPIGTESK